MDSKRTRASCSDCYFHCAALCALRLEEACPTFRHHVHGGLVQPRPLLVGRRPAEEALLERRLAGSAA